MCQSYVLAMRFMRESRDSLIAELIATTHPLLIMTTLESQSGENLCHLEKLPHVKWNNSISGLSGCTFPDGLSPLECQMAGHPFDGEKHTIGKRNFHRLLFHSHANFN